MKAAFHTLGCKTNAYETQAVIEQFEAAGYEIVDFSGIADVYVINTCSVTAEAARKSRQMLRRAKGKNPNAVVAACGCFAQEAKEKLLKDGSVDLCIGNNEKSALLSMVTDYCRPRKEASDTPENLVSHSSPHAEDGMPPASASDAALLVTDLTHCRQYETQMISNAGSHVRAYVKIQDGCDRFCSYCIIPFLRGRSRSRELSAILSEVQTLAAQGIREIVLTGIDISDFRIEDRTPDESFLALLSGLHRIEGIERIRLGSLEEGILSSAFIQQLKDFPKLCPHFHLSLQSGSNAILARMNRKYSTEEFEEAVRMLRETFRDPAITTDIICGFPGETEAEFEETLVFAERIGFSQMHVFPYSRRKGTKADKMDGQLSRAEKAARCARLIEAGEKMQDAFMKSFLGREVSVLLEEEVRYQEKTYFIGFTPEYIRTLVPAQGHHINKIVTIVPERTGQFQKERILL